MVFIFVFSQSGSGAISLDIYMHVTKASCNRIRNFTKLLVKSQNLVEYYSTNKVMPFLLKLLPNTSIDFTKSM